MKSKIIFLCVFSSSLSFAQVDYSKCNNAMGNFYGPKIDNDGKLELGLGEKLVSKETKGNQEIYEIENDGSVYGFGIGQAGEKTNKRKVVLTRDSNGNVITFQNGGDSLSKSEIKQMKDQQLQFQMQQAVWGADATFGKSLNSGMQFSGYGTIVNEPSYYVIDKEGKSKVKKIKELTKEERKYVGISDELYKNITGNFRKDKKIIKKIEKGLKKIQDDGKSAFYLGDKTEFLIENGKCQPLEKSTRMYREADQKVHENLQVSIDGCLQIESLYNKYQKDITQCNDSSLKLTDDYFKMQQSGKGSELGFTGMGGYGGYPGLGMGGYGGGYGGFGGFGGIHGQLSMQKINCDQFFGDSLHTPQSSEKSQSSGQSAAHVIKD